MFRGKRWVRSDVEARLSSLFPIAELLMLGAFMAGLIWLVIEKACHESDVLESMLTDADGTAFCTPQRRDFRHPRRG